MIHVRSIVQTIALGGSLLLSGALLTVANAATTLTVSSWVPPTHFIHTDFLVPFAEQVATATEGRVRLTILPKPLGSPPQHFEIARKGVADITWGNFTYEPERFLSLWFAEFPFAGTQAEASSRALWQTWDRHLKDNPAFQGVKMLGVGLLGGGQIHHSQKAIIEPEDMANQKIRMGGPIQKRLLEELGAVPVAAPAPKAYELLESGVIDGSLHSTESIVNFRLEGRLTHHTIVPDGLYDGTFFVVMNGKKWARLADEDREAIEKISGEALSALWGRQFDVQNAAAYEQLKTAGHEFRDASPALLDKVREVAGTMTADWEAAASKAGVADPAAVYADYLSTYKTLAK